MFLKTLKASLVATTALVMAATSAQAADEVEVLHWWTAGGEAGALTVLKDDLSTKGITWKDMPVAGGGGAQAMTVLRARVTSGNPPTAVQMTGFDLKDWAAQGVLADLNDLATQENWDAVIPKAVQDFSKQNGKWVAAPVNVHSTNWVWANKKILDDLGIAQPTTWDEFVAALTKVQEAGKVALAHGGQAWQDATMAESLALGVGGLEFYKKAFIDLDEAALQSDQMKEVFNRMAVLRSFVDDNFSGRDWNLATAMVINEEAAFQIMGDWAKGEFINAGKVPDQDFLCFRVPGSQGVVTFNADQFAMFDSNGENDAVQAELAKAVMSPTFQSAFNVVKGSAPARIDVPNDAFDACGQKGMQHVAAADANDTLVGSMAHGYAAPAAVKNAIFDVVTAHFNGEYGDVDEAIEELVIAIDIAK